MTLSTSSNLQPFLWTLPVVLLKISAMYAQSHLSKIRMKVIMKWLIESWDFVKFWKGISPSHKGTIDCMHGWYQHLFCLYWVVMYQGLTFHHNSQVLFSNQKKEIWEPWMNDLCINCLPHDPDPMISLQQTICWLLTLSLSLWSA
jgi:hypothetical protein